jgi:hypothetical protein
MLRTLFIFSVITVFSAAAFAQEEFTPGSESTLKWVGPEKGFEQMLEEIMPGFLYIYSSYKPEFCKAVETEIIPSKTVGRKFRKFVCIKLSSDEESDILNKYKVEQGEAAALFLDSQGKVVESIKDEPAVSDFSSALSKAEKANKEIKKFLGQIEDNYKRGEAYFKKQYYHKAAQHFMAIVKAREDYEEKKGEIQSPYFDKAETKIAEIKEEGTKLLIKANAAIMKDDFANGSVLLSKVRTEFALFPDIIKKCEDAEVELQRRMQRAQQGTGK